MNVDVVNAALGDHLGGERCSAPIAPTEARDAAGTRAARHARSRAYQQSRFPLQNQLN